MKRSEFLLTTSRLACGSCLAALAGAHLDAAEPPADATVTPVNEALKQSRYENTFTAHWLTDLFEAIDREVDPAVQLKLMRACGEGCYRRHPFKQEIAAAAAGDVDKLLAAYRRNYGIEREGSVVHIRYGDHCYCPAARQRPARPHDLHCECTRFTHETIFTQALGRPIRVELLESVRRGGRTCHLVAHLT